MTTDHDITYDIGEIIRQSKTVSRRRHIPMGLIIVVITAIIIIFMCSKRALAV